MCMAASAEIMFCCVLSAQVVAWVFVAIATVMLLLVCLRMALHNLQVLQGRERWDDPLARECDERGDDRLATAAVRAYPSGDLNTNSAL